MTTLSWQDALVLCLCFVVHFIYRVRKRHLLPLPPGPTRWPIIGSALSMDLSYAHIAYKLLGKKLGTKLLYFEVLGQSIIVINDVQAAQELLGKRSAIYSDRPQIRIFSEGNGLDRFFVTMPYGDEWRAHRRMFQQYFGPKHISRQMGRNERMLRFVRRGLLPNLLASPEDFREHIKNCIGGFSVSITYGLPVQRQHDPRVQFAESVLGEIVETGSPGKFLINFVSSLFQDIPEWMPGAGFKNAARGLRSRIDRMVNEPCQATQELFDQGDAEESFLVANLEKGGAGSEDKVNRIKYTAGQVFGGASETTTAATLSLVLTMLKNQDVQRQVQQELDSVVGPDRMPTMEDIPQLPYLSAVIKETLRQVLQRNPRSQEGLIMYLSWNPIAPLGVPRMTTCEDVYNGYYIPKGSVIITNIYAMLYDEVVYPEPTKFDPGRFIKDGILRDNVPDPEFVATFGFGRRICPGSHIALPLTYLINASILHLFDILPDVDSRGNPIDIVPEFPSASLTSEPCPFPCKIMPRGDRNVPGLLKEYLDDGPV